jgi:hypothetical protein
VNLKDVSESLIRWSKKVPALDSLQAISSNNQPFKRKLCDDVKKMVSGCIRVHDGKPGNDGCGCFNGILPDV